MKNQRVALIGSRGILLFVACLTLALSSMTGCESIPKDKYQALHNSFESYVQKDKDKRDSIKAFLTNQLKALESKEQKTKADKKEISRIKFQLLSMKTWDSRQSRADKFLKDSEIDD